MGPMRKKFDDRLALLFWETTAACNLNCIHCRRLDTAKEDALRDLTLDESFALIDSLVKLGRPILVLSGGEPLCRVDIFDIAARASSAGLPLALATNGTLIDSSVAKSIAKSGVRRVSVSLDGADSATHDGFRMLDGSFEAALRGIEELKKAGLSVQINTTIARHNYRQVESLYQLALAIEVDALHIFMLVPVGCGVQIADEQMLSAGDYEAILNWLYDKSKEGKLRTKATCAPHYFRVMAQRSKADGQKPQRKSSGMEAMTRGCLAGSSVCFVSHEGDVFPCGYLPVVAGNTRRMPLEKIWAESELFARLRDPALLGGKCGACEYRNICLGCRARAYYDKGDYLAEEPYCSYVPRAMREG